MAYDEDLADRMCALIADESDLTEQRTFGGLAFLIGGNMAFAASGQGGPMVRVTLGTTYARSLPKKRKGDQQRSRHLAASN